jgi:DNA-binding MarR family transcriptional regulator
VYTSNTLDSLPCACTTIKKLSRILARSYDDALAGAGINITQFAVMRCIARRTGEPLSRVAEEMEMDRTSLYRAISPMIRDGWLEMAAGTDARSRSAKVTRRGSQLLARAAVPWNNIQERLVGHFGKDAWKALVGELNRLADSTQAASAR